MTHFSTAFFHRLATLAAMCILTVTGAMAREITPTEALCRLSADAHGVGLSHKPQQLRLVRTMAQAEQPVLYAFNRTDGHGYVITSADDNNPAVLGYAEEGCFEDAMTVPGFKHWIEEAQQAMTYSRSAKKASTQPQLHPLIKPMLTTTWGQGDTKLNVAPHYNIYTPQVNGQQCLVGCTATAMAQVMKYYEYPAIGRGSHSYEFDRIGTVSADFDVRYRWDLMQDHYGFTVIDGDTINCDFTDEANQAVSTLMYHCGVGCDMQYGVTASSAWELDGAYALTEYFGYDRGIHGEHREFYNDREWDNMIYAELVAGRPFIYVAYTEKGFGHTFVADGYLNGLYHINWGWNGLANGYYTILTSEALHAKTLQIGGKFVYDAFVSRHSVVLGIQPPADGTALHPTLCLEGSYNVSHDYMTSTVMGKNDVEHYLTSKALLHNYSCRPLTVTFGVRLVDPESGRHYEFEDNWGTSYMLRIYDVANADFKFIPHNVPDGTYKVYIIYRVEGEKGWFEAQTLPQTSVPVITFSDGIEPEPEQTEPEGIQSATIDDSTNSNSTATYDLSGRRITSRGHGIVIRGNEKMIK